MFVALPAPPLFHPRHTFFTHHLQYNPNFEDLCSVKETYFELQNPRNVFDFEDHTKSEKRNQSCYSETELFINWCPDIINSKTIGVRAYLIQICIPITKIPEIHFNNSNSAFNS